MCDREWHADEACEEFKKRMSGDEKERERKEQEKESKRYVDEKTKTCPGSHGFQIEKNEGCDHMRCKSTCMVLRSVC